MKRKSSKGDPEQPHVGVYRLGISNVDLYGRAGFGGEFYCTPDKTSMPRVKVGFGYEYWWEVVATVMHESFEFLAAQRGVRFRPCGNSMYASDVYSFAFDHNAMSQMIEDQGYFLAQCLPDLAAAWKSWRRAL